MPLNDGFLKPEEEPEVAESSDHGYQESNEYFRSAEYLNLSGEDKQKKIWDMILGSKEETG